MRHSGLILSLLGALAAASAAAAYWVLVRAAPPAPPAAERLFVLLDDAAIQRVGKIRITYGLGLAGVQRLNFERQADGGFTITEYDSYPADAGALARMLAALQRLQPIERKTARPEWHRRLGLGAPQELGQAIQLEIWDDGGRELAGLLIGKKQQSEGARALSGARAETLAEEHFYVRRVNEAQSFLVRSAWRVPREPEDWLSQTLPWLAAEEVQRVRLRAESGAVRDFTRTAPDLPFADAAGVLSAVQAENLFQALRGLRVVRVARAERLAERGAPSAQLQLESFDGEQLTLEMRRVGPLSQLRFGARGTARAQAWQERYRPWIYMVQASAVAPLLLRAR